MAEKNMSTGEQRCISECIFKHWGAQSSTPPEHREEAYEACLSQCRVCS
jgi:hypothetical protein